MAEKRKRRGVRRGAAVTVACAAGWSTPGGVRHARVVALRGKFLKTNYRDVLSLRTRGTRWALGWTSKEAAALEATQLLRAST